MEEIIKCLEEIKEYQMDKVQLARSTDIYKLADKALKKALSINVVMQAQPEKVLNTYPYERQLKRIDQLNQTQISLKDQLKLLRLFANKLGLNDAADYIKD